MKLGKVSQTVYKRSILKQMKSKREENLLASSIEEMCAGIKAAKGQEVIYTTQTLYGNEKDLGVYAIAKGANDLASRGATPIGVTACINLPDYAYESRLKAMVGYMEEACEQHQMMLQNIEAEVLPVLSSTVISVTVIGTVEEEKLLETKNGKAGQDLVLVKWVGLEGTLRVLNAKEEELKTRFIPGFLKQTKAYQSEIFSLDAITLARENGATSIHQIGSGGILGTLWEVAEACNVGLTVEQKKMSIKQETIEICEFYRMNPYQLTSTGSLIIMIDNGKTLVRQLDEVGIYAEVIGRTTAERERVIMGGEEKRFIDRPAPDELTRIYHPAEGN